MKTFREWVNENFDDPFADPFGGAGEPDNSAQDEEQVRTARKAFAQALEGMESIVQLARVGGKSSLTPEAALNRAEAMKTQYVQLLTQMMQSKPHLRQEFDKLNRLDLRAIANNLEAIQKVRMSLSQF